MKVSIGCDHGGYELKEEVKAHLLEKGIEVVDFGTNDLSSCDYPDFGIAAAKAVAEGKVDKGIVICTTGIGISIAANKVKGVRCALCSDLTSARLTREHNDANVLALGAAITGNIVAVEIVDTFLTTEFSGLEKHVRRIEKIKAQEELF